MLLVNITLTLVPALLLLVWANRRVRTTGRLAGGILVATGSGIAAVAVAVAIGLLVDTLLPGMRAIRVLDAFVMAGLIEEGVKVSAAWLVSSRAGYASSRQATVAVAVAVGVGFALVENVYYLVDSPGVVLLRGVMAVPLHAGTSALIGRLLYRARGGSTVAAVAALLAPAILHGTYDLLVGSAGWMMWLSIPLLVAIVITASVDLPGQGEE
jgi:RsiW-degrading membrane proteinase PrsW (M82 family)